MIEKMACQAVKIKIKNLFYTLQKLVRTGASKGHE
jgi:hypothetical protein